VTSQERRVVGVGVALVLAVAIPLRLGPAVTRWARDSHDRLVVERALVARREAELSLLPRLEARADSLRTRFVALAGRLIPGGTAAEAQSELMAAVQVAARGQRDGGKLEQSEPVPDTVTIGPLHRVQVRAAWASDLDGALAFLRTLEFSPTLMHVRDVRLETAPGQDPGADRVRAQVVLEGWYRPEQGL
jgi:hypothetical protein